MPAPAATSWRGPIPLYTLELAPARAFSHLKAPILSAFTFKNLLRHYATQAHYHMGEIGTAMQRSSSTAIWLQSLIIHICVEKLTSQCTMKQFGGQ